MSERLEGGLWCHEVLERLDAYVAGELADAELAALTAHVQACENCARFGGAYGRVVRALRGQEPAALDADRSARLLARLNEEIG